MRIGKTWLIICYLLPKCFGRYCDHHQGTFTRILTKYNKLPLRISKTTLYCSDECLRFFLSSIYNPTCIYMSTGRT